MKTPLIRARLDALWYARKENYIKRHGSFDNWWNDAGFKRIASLSASIFGYQGYCRIEFAMVGVR